MLPGTGAIDIALAAESWIGPIAARAETAGISSGMKAALHALLAGRRASPGAGVWQNKGDGQPGFVFNVNAFLDETGSFDVAGLGDAVRLAVTALTLGAPSAQRLSLGFTDLNMFLARLGLEYESGAARDTAVMLTAFISAQADVASAGMLARSAAGYPVKLTKLPEGCAVADLKKATVAAQELAQDAGVRRHEALLGVSQRRSLRSKHCLAPRCGILRLRSLR